MNIFGLEKNISKLQLFFEWQEYTTPYFKNIFENSKTTGHYSIKHLKSNFFFTIMTSN